MKKLSYLAFASILTGLLGAGAPPAAAADQVKIAVDGGWRPYGYIDKDGKLTGFDVDISEALCAEMKRQCQILNVPFAGIFAALDARNADAIVAGLYMTDARKEKYDFAGPYYVDPIRWMTLASSPIDGSEQSLKGKSIGTIESAIYAQAIKDKMGPASQIQTYDNMDAAVLDLDAGRIDAVVGEGSQFTTTYIAKDPSKYKLVGEPVSDKKYMGEGKGIVLRKGDDVLRDEFNTALAAIIANGKRAEISKKYFGVVLPIAAK